MSITTFQAANLATRYHDVMRMVGEQSSIHLPAGTSPLQCLEGYLQACKVCGVSLHDDEWEAYAEGVVEMLTRRRRAALAKVLGRYSQPERGC